MNLEKKTFRLYNEEYYLVIFLEYQNFMEVEEEYGGARRNHSKVISSYTFGNSYTFRNFF